MNKIISKSIYLLFLLMTWLNKYIILLTAYGDVSSEYKVGIWICNKIKSMAILI